MVFKLDYCNNCVHENSVWIEDDIKIVAESPSLLGHPAEGFFLNC